MIIIDKINEYISTLTKDIQLSNNLNNDKIFDEDNDEKWRTACMIKICSFRSAVNR